MFYTLTKIVISAVLITLISELAKRHSLLGAMLASIPLVSVLAMCWLYHDTHSVMSVSQLASNIFWLVLPSLVLFLLLPVLLKQGLNFYLALFLACLVTSGAYWLTLQGLLRWAKL